MTDNDNKDPQITAEKELYYKRKEICIKKWIDSQNGAIRQDNFFAWVDGYDAAYNQLSTELKQLRAVKDGAYSERNKLVAALSKLFPAWLERHPDSDTTWEDDWRWIVFIQLPTGQASWHIHDSELEQFNHLECKDGNSWDGHTTDEKYSRLASITGVPELKQLRAENKDLISIIDDIRPKMRERTAENNQLRAERAGLERYIDEELAILAIGGCDPTSNTQRQVLHKLKSKLTDSAQSGEGEK